MWVCVVCHGCYFSQSFLHSTGDEITKLLLEEAKMDPNAKNDVGDTPLHTALKNEKYKQVQLLVRDERCNPNEKDSRGDTALHVACRLSYEGELLTICCHVPVVYMNKCVV